MRTEKDKMLAGENYNPGDETLIARWHYAKDLMQRYNSLDTRDLDGRDRLLSLLLGKKGCNIWIAAPFYCDYGENIYIGDNTEINMNCVFLDCNSIAIGSYTLIAPSVQIYTVSHPIAAVERFNTNDLNENRINFANSITAPVTIGNRVWIGGGSIILPGVAIGDNTTVGAGSVVTKSIPANKLAVGNPCKVIRDL